MSRAQEQTLWVPGRPGWQGQQGSTTGLSVIGVILGLFVVGAAVIWLLDPAPSVKALGASALVALAVAGWMLVSHLRVGRARVVRAVVDGPRIAFAGARGVILPTRLLAVVGVIMLGAWVWALLTAPSDSMSIVTLLGVPVVAIALMIGGIRAWLPGAGSHSLTLTPQGLSLRIPRNGLDVSWAEVQSAELNANRVHVLTTARAGISFAARDLASDPAILAELITYYAQTPAARAEVGEGTLRLLSDGGL